MRYILLLGVMALLSGCSPDLNKAGQLTKSMPDEHGVVCYASPSHGAFSCVKVK